MAFYRKYDLREKYDVLILYFYINEKLSSPSLIIRFRLDGSHMDITRISPYVSVSLINEEIRRLYELFDNPHWKSYVNLRSIYNHPEDYGSLF